MATEATATVRRRRFEAAGTSSRLVEAGPEEASTAVVFLHGNPGSSDDWEPLVGAVGATGTRALAFDLPDFGETIAPAGFEHSVPGYAAFVDAALAALGVERVHLVLHDFGGPIGLAWTATHADRLASLTLIDIGILPGYKWHRLARIWRTPVLGELFQAIADAPRLPRQHQPHRAARPPPPLRRNDVRPLRPPDQARGAEALPRHRRAGRARPGPGRGATRTRPAGAGRSGAAATPTCRRATPSARRSSCRRPRSTSSPRAATGPSPTTPPRSSASSSTSSPRP